jgi:hypothetical protein
MCIHQTMHSLVSWIGQYQWAVYCARASSNYANSGTYTSNKSVSNT